MEELEKITLIPHFHDIILFLKRTTERIITLIKKESSGQIKTKNILTNNVFVGIFNHRSFARLRHLVENIFSLKCRNGVANLKETIMVKRPVHMEIRCVFEVSGRHYEAVSFFREGEKYIPAEIMLERVDKDNGGLIGDEEIQFISDHRKELPSELERYFLVTKLSTARFQKRCFFLEGSFWHIDWVGGNAAIFFPHFLALRRLPGPQVVDMKLEPITVANLANEG